MDVTKQGLSLGVFDNAQAHLAAPASDRAHNQRAIMGMGNSMPHSLPAVPHSFQR